MATLIKTPAAIEAAGLPPKLIEEFFGRVNSSTENISIARMKSPGGWKEPGQIPQFDEYSIVLKGSLHVHLRDGNIDVHAGQAVLISKGEWVQYSTPSADGAEYIAVCQPAFSRETVNREK